MYLQFALLIMIYGRLQKNKNSQTGACFKFTFWKKYPIDTELIYK